MKQSKALLTWYLKNSRPLPWRKSKDPYRIWVSEIMLQQTTVKAVTPYFERFMKRFPDVHKLARAKEESVIQNWAGLGYYSRARNLHKAAKFFSKNGFPKTWEELIKLPGLGPYTARAISSLSFAEPVGVLDGNVIRFLSRFHDLDLEWWKPKEREKLQAFADGWVSGTDSSVTNQALIEIGATLCTPGQPHCTLCPVRSECLSHKNSTIELRPRPKPRRAREIWLWSPRIPKKGKKFGLVLNEYAPFLAGHLIWPGQVQKLGRAPKNFDFRHSITHHDIFVKINGSKSDCQESLLWISAEELKKKSPTSLIQKSLMHL